MSKAKSDLNEIPAAVSWRKCLLFAVPVIRADLELVSAIIELPHSRHMRAAAQRFHSLRDVMEIVERAADGEAIREAKDQFREAWHECKEAAVMDQDYETAVYFRDTQDLFVLVDVEFPNRPAPYVRSVRTLNRGPLAGHSALHGTLTSRQRAREGLRTIEGRKALYDRYRAEVFGPSPPIAFSLEWRTDTAVSLARQMYDAREFSAMPILADALQDAGCDDEAILAHCRDPKQVHVRGCWVTDLVLDKK